MCAVVTVGAVVGPTCGACAARARRWPTAYRCVPKRCAPQKLGTFQHKDNQSGDFCLLCAEKASSSLQISFIRRCFLLFIVHSSAKTRKPYRPRWGFALHGANWHKKTAKPPTDTRGVCRRFGRCLIGIGTLFRHIAVRDSAIGHEVRGGLRLSGRCGR